MPDKLGVFLSWSGPKSRALASVFRSWLPAVIQRIEPYFTPDDVAKGVRWNQDLSRELELCSRGVLFMTPGNTRSPWILFEAGALSKSVGAARVCPMLFGLDPSELAGPLSQFQAVEFQKDHVRALASELNEELQEFSLEQSVLDRVFDKWWPDLEEGVTAALSEAEEEAPDSRSERELIGEVLQLVRSSTFQSYVRGSGPDQSAVAEIVHLFAEIVELSDRGRPALEPILRMDPPIARLLVQCRFGMSKWNEMRSRVVEVIEGSSRETIQRWGSVSDGGARLFEDEVFGISPEET